MSVKFATIISSSPPPANPVKNTPPSFTVLLIPLVVAQQLVLPVNLVTLFPTTELPVLKSKIPTIMSLLTVLLTVLVEEHPTISNVQNVKLVSNQPNLSLTPRLKCVLLHSTITYQTVSSFLVPAKTLKNKCVLLAIRTDIHWISLLLASQPTQATPTTALTKLMLKIS